MKKFVMSNVSRLSCCSQKEATIGDYVLLQQESREVGLVGTVINQILILSYVKKNHPDLIAFFQVQRQLKGQRAG